MDVQFLRHMGALLVLADIHPKYLLFLVRQIPDRRVQPDEKVAFPFHFLRNCDTLRQ